jgi:hypothetical protein
MNDISSLVAHPKSDVLIQLQIYLPLRIVCCQKLSEVVQRDHALKDVSELIESCEGVRLIVSLVILSRKEQILRTLGLHGEGEADCYCEHIPQLNECLRRYLVLRRHFRPDIVVIYIDVEEGGADVDAGEESPKEDGGEELLRDVQLVPHVSDPVAHNHKDYHFQPVPD